MPASANPAKSANPTASAASDIRYIIAAVSAGSLIEWYDFYVFGSMATLLAGQLFPASDPTAGLLAVLAIFAAGFIVRPFGSRVFGRPGDLTGRKNRFLLTTVLMGGATFAIGLVPGYASIGFMAPVLVVLLRLLQGLALGAGYGSAVTYVAEHSPVRRRGFFTSWIQAAPSLGLLISLGVILLTRNALDADHAASIEKFNAWGWRIPFLLAIVLVLVSVYIRLKMQESPLFSPPKAEARSAVSPLALFGAAIGSGVVFYTGQFYAQSFLENVCKLDFDQSKTALLIAIALATPFFILFGAWSDRIGRKWIMLAGMTLAIVTYPFLFRQLLTTTGTKGRTELTDQKEIRSTVAFIGRTRDMIRTSATLRHYDGDLLVTETEKDTVYASGKTSARPVTGVSETLGTEDYWKIVAILFVLVFFATMVCGYVTKASGYAATVAGPAAANSIFGGMTPFVATLLTTICTGSKLAGLGYPIGVAAVCVLIGVFYLPGRKAAGQQDSTQES